MLNRYIPKWLNTKFLIAAFCAMIFTHMVLFIIFSQHNSSTEYKINRDVLARQAISFVQTVKSTPEKKQAKLIDTLDIPNFTVSLNKHPKYKLTFDGTSLWQVLVKISDQQPNIQFSYLLSPHHWLNLSVAVVPTSFGLQVFLLTLEIALIIAILAFLWLINRFTVPLRRFSKVAEQFGVDLQTEPLPEEGPKVVLKTARAMNRMQQRIRNLLQARTQMLAALSHDLRTPITRLKLRAQYIEDIQVQSKVIADLDEMEAMISETLNFAKDESSREQRVLMDLTSLVSSVCDDFEETGHRVSFNASNQRYPIRGGSVALRRVFTNLIGNAIKYGHCAKVKMYYANHEAVCLIDDEGPGLPEDQLEKVFLPFYRAETSRSRETGGTGLGLAVAKDIVQAHGGEITLRTRPVGLRVIVKIPIVKI